MPTNIISLLFPQRTGSALTTAKKSWNNGVISSCQYLQEKCDVKKLSQSAFDKAKEAYNNSGNETKDHIPASTPDSSESVANQKEDDSSE